MPVFGDCPNRVILHNISGSNRNQPSLRGLGFSHVRNRNRHCADDCVAMDPKVTAIGIALRNGKSAFVCFAAWFSTFGTSPLCPET